MEIRKKTKELEMVWRGSHSFGRLSDIFTSNLASGMHPILGVFRIPPHPY
jgi:hypothetical protein